MLQTMFEPGVLKQRAALIHVVKRSR